MHQAGQRDRRERGSATAEFVLVGSLLTVFTLAIVQLALVLHVRNTLVDAAASAARYGSLADRGDDDARQRAVEIVSLAVGGDYATDISVGESNVGSIRVLEVRVRAPVPLIGLVGPSGFMEVAGHAPLP